MTIRHLGRALALLIVGLSASQVDAASVTATQTFDFDYTYFRDEDATAKFGTIMETASKLGSSSLYGFWEGGVERGGARFLVDFANDGIIRTMTDFELRADNGDTSNGVLTEIDGLIENEISYLDRVTANDPRGEIFRFQTVVTGGLSATTDYGAFGFTLGVNVFQELLAYVEVGSGGTINLVGGTLSGDSAPGFDPSPIDVTRTLNDEFLIVENLGGGDDVRFQFWLRDTIELNAAGLDVERLEVQATNDLSRTIRIHASVFDAAGNLLPDARVISSSGFVYDPIPGLVGSSVPEPSSVALIALGLAGLWFTRRRSS